jgi:Heterokaryon incompatibility protein (HET)
MADFDQEDVDPAPDGGRIPPVSFHHDVDLKRFQSSNTPSWQKEPYGTSRDHLRSAIEKVIQQNRRKQPERYDFPGARFRNVVEEVIRHQKLYTHEPIDPHNEIRILRLHRGKKGDTLKCTLFRSSLQSTRSTSKFDCYEYHALSYVWGDGNVTVRINMYTGLEQRERIQRLTLPTKPCGFYIRTNLAAALQNIRQESEDINLWVDAVCINQIDIAEKAAQIGLMYRIYKEATSVLAWIGESSLDTSLALDLLKALATSRAQDDIPGTEAKMESWKSVLNLTKASYSRRAWTLQELPLWDKCQVMWGSETMKSETMKKAWSTILTRREQVEALLNEAGWDDFSKKSLFNGITLEIESQSDPSTKRQTGADDMFETERANPATPIQDHDDDVEEAALLKLKFQCSFCSKKIPTLGKLK